ncbi:MAG: phosphate ABC transporter permease subunit PstC [Anaerolineae bacterium]|nr:phosphate ABC transporter permease subunit PstC [Anaerolineae bacterium]MDW8101665.1 phosphate ABC transporter permease subunit PstC [Anaerolineae bacterium]
MRLREKFLEGIFAFCASFSIFTTLGVIAVLVFESFAFFQEVPITRFLTETQWTPLFARKHFGIIVLISGTFLTTVIAMMVSLPLGLMAAIYMSEYAPERVRRILKPSLEILAGIPTVVYGYFALLFVTPLLKKIIPFISGFNALSAGIVMGFMILPTVASLSEDAIYAVPRSLREGAYALGATTRQVVTGVVIPTASSGILASFILGVSRALGETMIVAIAAGQTPRLTLNPLVSIETMTAYIVQVSLGDVPTGSLEFRTIFAVGMTLFLMNLTFNLLSYWLASRQRRFKL